MNIKTTERKVDEGIKMIQEQGGKVKGNVTDGSAKIQGVSARFQWRPLTSTLTVVIDDKPWFATNSMIEEKIKEFFQ